MQSAKSPQSRCSLKLSRNAFSEETFLCVYFLIEKLPFDNIRSNNLLQFNQHIPVSSVGTDLKILEL